MPKNHHLLQGQIEQTFAYQNVALLANIFNCLIVSFILRNQTSWLPLGLWVLSIFILSGVRYYHTSHFQTEHDTEGSSERWQNLYTVHLILTGLLWGCLALFFFPADSIGHQVFIAFILGGMLMGASVSASALPYTYLFFSIPVIIPLALRFVLITDEVHIAIGIQMLIFYGFCLSISRVVYRASCSNILLQNEKNSEIQERVKVEQTLKVHQENLEKQIHERTVELEETNKNLRYEIEVRQQAEEKYRVIFNSPNDAIILHKQTGEIVDVNQTMLKMFGYSYSEATALTPDAYCSGTPPFTFLEAMKKIRETNMHGPQLFEWEAKNKKGDRFWIEISLKEIELNKRKYIVAAMRDIDRRKQAEKALNEKQKLHNLLFDKGSDGIVLYKTDTNLAPDVFIEVNSKALEMLGYSREEFLRLAPKEFIQPEKRRAMQKIVQQKKDFGGNIIYETTLVRKNGTLITVEINDHSFENDGQHLALAIVRDISQRKQLENELYRNENLQSLGTLAGGIAHDFNNLLTALFGNIELAKLTLNDHEKARACLDQASDSLKRASALTKQLLTFSKGGDPAKQTISLPSIVESAAQFALSGSDIQCEVKYKPHLNKVYIDIGQIEQVINHIVLNAKEAMKEEGHLSISIDDLSVKKEDQWPLPPGNYLACEIIDEGVGIEQKDINKIFDPYYSSKGRGQKKGTGLGLSICHSIIKKHKGHIAVTSQKNKGTKITILLPAHKEDNASSLWTEKLLRKTTSLQHTKKVLILEDEESVAQILKDLFHYFNMQCTIVSDGVEAVDEFSKAIQNKDPYQCTILDLTIRGGLGGKKTAEKILQIDPEAYLVVSSGYTENEIMTNYRSYGFQAAISKPFTMESLRKTLDPLFESNEKKQALSSSS